MSVICNGEMAVKTLLLFFAFTLCQGISAQIADHSKPELPRSYRFSDIKRILIEQNAAWSGTASSSDETPESCSKFKLTRHEVLSFFKKAKRIGPGTYDYLPFSRCYAKGKIVFRNGDRGTWHIDYLRRGEIVLSDGRCAYFYGLEADSGKFGEAIQDFEDPFLGQPERPPATPEFHPGPIQLISFRRRILWEASEEQSSGKCRFELSEGEVRDFFKQAKAISLEEFNALKFGKGNPVAIPAPTGCHVEGDIQFADGRIGSWMIENNRTGILAIKGGITAYLYAESVRSEAFKPRNPPVNSP